MGYIVHHAIIVVGFQEEGVATAHAEAMRQFDGIAPVTEVVSTSVNSYLSFMVAPDGSKEGWDHSQKGDAARDAFVEWLGKASSLEVYLDWFEVMAPEDERATVARCDFDEPDADQ